MSGYSVAFGTEEEEGGGTDSRQHVQHLDTSSIHVSYRGINHLRR